jgi:hypothetical protein
LVTIHKEAVVHQLLIKELQVLKEDLKRYGLLLWIRKRKEDIGIIGKKARHWIFFIFFVSFSGKLKLVLGENQ